MTREPIYHFEFGVRRKTMAEEDCIETRDVPFEKLLECFDMAYDWVMTNPDKRYAEVYGPGMANRVVTHTAREYLLNRLPDELLKKERQYVGLLWIDLLGIRGKIAYRLYKVYRAEMRMPDMPEKRIPQHGLVEIQAPDLNKAFHWVYERGWKDYGIWIKGKPALAFCPDFTALEEVLSHTAIIGQHMEDGRLIRAPVHYGQAAFTDAYPRVAPTRSTREIQKLRARYPTASEDLKYCPLEVLIRRYGYREAAA